MPPFRSLLALLGFTLFAGSLPAQVSVTFSSIGTGIQVPFIVSGTGCSAGAYNLPTSLTWTPGASCTVSITSPLYPQTGVQDTFTGWQDGVTANPRTFVAPAQHASYIANFTIQVYLATVSPSQGGTLSGGGWYP